MTYIKGLTGLKEVIIGLYNFESKISSALSEPITKIMDSLRKDMILRTPLDTSDRRDNVIARQHWSPVENVGNTYYFQLDSEYGLTLDKGSAIGYQPWPSPGPRTEIFKGRIFSTQVSDGEGGITAEVLKEEREKQIVGQIFDMVIKELANDMGR
jgi:hypothetical protein